MGRVILLSLAMSVNPTLLAPTTVMRGARVRRGRRTPHLSKGGDLLSVSVIGRRSHPNG